MPYADLGCVFYSTNDDKSSDVLLFSTNWDEFEAARKLLAVSYNWVRLSEQVYNEQGASGRSYSHKNVVK